MFAVIPAIGICHGSRERGKCEREEGEEEERAFHGRVLLVEGMEVGWAFYHNEIGKLCEKCVKCRGGRSVVETPRGFC